MATLIFSLAIFVLSITFISCSSSNEQPSVPNASLTNTKWVLRDMYGQKISTAQGGKEIYIILTTVENKANGSGGCNNFSATYSVMGKKIIFEKIISTEMFCENKMNTESEFFKVLENALSYRIKDDILSLSDISKVTATLEAVNSK